MNPTPTDTQTVGQQVQHGLTPHSHGLVAEEAPGVTVPEVSRAQRFASTDPSDFPAISGREEIWRFTPVERMRGLATEELSGEAPVVEIHVPEGVQQGVFTHDDGLSGHAGTPEDLVAAKAWAQTKSVHGVTIPKEARPEAPIVVTVTGSGEAPAASHLVIEANEFSEATVVVDHRGQATLASNTEIIVRDGAKLNVVSIQDWDAGSVHQEAQHAVLGRDAYLKHVNVTFGGDIVRLLPSAKLTSPGSEVELFGLYFADAGQHQEQRSFVDHAAPNCTSNVMYKGALQGKSARTVWVGDVLIRKEAEGTNTYELNRNLVLTDGARADSVPNLEIETGLIEGAGHASATGRFDDEQLFYLMSRGVPAERARKLVVRGFLNEVIQKVGVADVQERLLAKVDEELGNTPEAE